MKNSQQTQPNLVVQANNKQEPCTGGLAIRTHLKAGAQPQPVAILFSDGSRAEKGPGNSVIWKPKQ